MVRHIAVCVKNEKKGQLRKRYKSGRYTHSQYTHCTNRDKILLKTCCTSFGVVFFLSLLLICSMCEFHCERNTQTRRIDDNNRKITRMLTRGVPNIHDNNVTELTLKRMMRTRNNFVWRTRTRLPEMLFIYEI